MNDSHYDPLDLPERSKDSEDQEDGYSPMRSRGGRGKGRVATRRGSGARRSARRKEPVAFVAGTVRSVTGLDTRGARFEVDVAGVRGKVSAEIIGEFGLRKGRDLNEAEAESLSAAVQRLEVFDRGVAILARRPRSARDLLNRLRRAGASQQDAVNALERLQALGLQDDNAYANHVAATRAATGRLSKRGLQQELIRKGVAPKVASGAVDNAAEGAELDDEEGALALVERRLRSLKNLDDLTRRRRLYGLLARRGYESALIVRVLRKVLSSSDSDD